ncbi:MAG: hypothetical protein WCF90_05895 [Methanomicrobiales archaeon]
MQNQAHIQFRREIRQFYLICILNIVFAALLMAFGMSDTIAAILGTTGLPASAIILTLTGVVAMVRFGFGISWLLSTVRVFKGVKGINNKLTAEGMDSTDDRINCLIVQMLSHHRNNRPTIDKMIRVCTFGSTGFFSLGVGTSLEVLSVYSGGIQFNFNKLMII